MILSHASTSATGSVPENEHPHAPTQSPLLLGSRKQLKGGITITKLTLLERLSILAKIISTMVIQLFNRDEIPQNSIKILKWLKEVKTGEEIIKTTLSPRESPILESPIGARKLNPPSPVIDESVVRNDAKESKDSTVLDDLEVLDDTQGSDDANGFEETDILLDDQGLLDDTALLDDSEDELDESDSEPEAHKEHREPPIAEKKEPAKKDDVKENEECAIKSPQLPKKQLGVASEAEIHKDISRPPVQDSSIETPRPDPNDSIDLIEDHESAATDMQAKKFKWIQDVVHSKNVKSWKLKAKEDPLLRKTDLYCYLKEMHAIFQQEKILVNDEAISKFTNFEKTLLAIRYASKAEDLDQINLRLQDEFVFHTLQEQSFDIQEMITGLKDGTEGKFKANMQALLGLFSLPSPTSSLSKDIAENQFPPYLSVLMEDTQVINESIIATLSENPQPVSSYHEFQAKLIESHNNEAKNGFIAYKEILQSATPSQPLKEKIEEYQQAEEAVHQAIKDLAKPLQDLLEDAKKPLTELRLSETLDKLNKIFKSISNIDNKPSLQDLLIQNSRHAARAYLLLKNKQNVQFSMSGLKWKINTVLSNMKALLKSTSKERLSVLIDLGNQVIADPDIAFNKYLDTKGILQFETSPPSDSSDVEEFLTKINQSLAKKRYTPSDLLAVEALTSVALYTYIINPQAKLDSKLKPIADVLKNIRDKISQELNADAVRSEVAELRKSDQNQKFYQFVKEKIESTANYPKNFWSDPNSAERMKIAAPLLPIIGLKIASPKDSLDEPAELVYQNAQIGYEIYLYPGSNTEKPKLLIFLTNPFPYGLTQEMNHQLGLYGDPKILKAAQDVVSNMTSTDVLEGYQQDLIDGNLEMITAGFDNCGSAATIVANRIAVLFPKTRVTSIAAGSTPVVTTEEAYNMKRAENFFPIRLKYVNDKNVDRTLTHLVGDFSEDSFNTFPLLVRYNQNSVDINKHNQEEYGNIDNFVPAMTNPLILRGMYQEFSDHIIYPKSKEIPVKTIGAELTLSSRSSLLERSVAASLTSLQVGWLDELINLGNHMLRDMNAYDDVFLKLEPRKVNPKELKLPKQLIQKGALTLEELENTIDALQQTIVHLKNLEMINLLNQEQAFSLLIAVDTVLINYMKINTGVGKLPQMIDLLSEIRELSAKRLESFYLDESQRKGVVRLFKEKGANLEHLASRVTVNPQFKDLIEKNDVLEMIDFEERFLDFLGFKIAVKDQEKIGSEAHVSKLYTSKSDAYDISLFTPEDPKKKQRIVICCNGSDQLGNHGLLNGLDFGAGDKAILARAEKLRNGVLSQLGDQFKRHQFNASDVEIVVTGFGSEGAVATALGYFLAKRYEKQQCQVRSVGFGAPRFTTEEGADKIRRQQNFVPLRFLSPTDTRFEWKMHTISDYPVSHNTYYTIPFQFRIVGTLELGGHNTNLYGDVQGIRTSMKMAYLMREIVYEKKRLKSLKQASETQPKTLTSGNLYDSVEATSEPITLPKRIVIDIRKNALADLSAKSVDELKKIEPGKLIRTMKYCAELSESQAISEDDKRLIHDFFKNFIEAIKNEDINENHPVKNAFCKKMLNHGYKPNQLFGGKWKLQNIISKDLKDAMKAVKKAEGTLLQKEKEELILRRSFQRGILAGDLNGNRYKPAGGGVNGAVFFRHLESGVKVPEALLPEETAHHPFLGIFKPHPETVRDFKGWFDMSQWAERVKMIAGMEAHLNPDDPDKRVNNEIFAYELFHIFGFDRYIGFPTTLKFSNKNDLKYRPASFCAYIPGCDLVAMHVKCIAKERAKSNVLNERKKTYHDNELLIWQMSKLFDFLAGNLDGHEFNAFVKMEKGKLVGAVNFDYDKAFAVDNPGNIGNQYKWAKLRISKNDFVEATKKALQEMLNPTDLEEKIKAFLAKAREDGKQNFTADQEKLLRERIELLTKIAHGEIKQLSDIKP